LRWRPFPLRDFSSENKVNFMESLFSIAGVGSPALKNGIAIYQYNCNDSMRRNVFCNADGDF